MTIGRTTEATQYSLVLETNAINQKVVTPTLILGSTSLIINNKIHLLVTMVIDSLNPTNRPSYIFKVHIGIMNQILKNNPQTISSISHNKALASLHQTEINLQPRQSKPNNIQQQQNRIIFVEGDNDYVNAITDFFSLNY